MFRSDYWEHFYGDEQLRNSKQTIFTRDFIVIKHGKFVCFYPFKKIKGASKILGSSASNPFSSNHIERALEGGQCLYSF